MQAIIRLKRPLEDSPSETLILNCNKKCKLDTEKNQAEEPLLTVLKFTGTQNSQDEDITKHVADLKCSQKNTNLAANFKKHIIDLNKKLRLEAQENSRKSRYRVVNCLRSNFATDSNKKENLTIYDLELGCDGHKSDQKFVYDLYYTNTKVLDEVDGYNISIYPTVEDLVLDSDEVYNMDEENNDSDDSNAENNWRNDYPDESDTDSMNDIIEAVKNCDVDDTLSSEDEEDPYYRTICSQYDEIPQTYDQTFGRFLSRMREGDSKDEDSLSQSDISENDDEIQ